MGAEFNPLEAEVEEVAEVVAAVAAGAAGGMQLPDVQLDVEPYAAVADAAAAKDAGMDPALVWAEG